MRRGREQADLVKACAAAHGVTTRAVRKWRDLNDLRWSKFLAERAAAGSLPIGSASGFVAANPRQWTDEELTMDTQLRRMRETVADLFERANIFRAAGDLDSEMNLRRVWADMTEKLRRLEKDAPGIQRDAGDSVPKRQMVQALVSYASEISALLSNLPDRILTLLPEIADARAQTIKAEIMDILAMAKEIRVQE
jgi:hypothetical protein